MNQSAAAPDLAGKIAIVTGAARGIGRAAAQVLSSHGAAVVINDLLEGPALETAAAIERSGGRAKVMIGDVANSRDVARLIEFTLSEFSSVHILVNNAGVLRPTRLPNISEQEWDLVVDSNLKGAFLCSQAVLPTFMRQSWGRIVNLSSTAGKNVSTLGGAHYTAAKAGVLGLTRAFAKEVAGYNVRVNAVCPGLVNTEMVQSTVSTERLRSFINGIPISRICEPEEIAQLIYFLVSDQSNYVTGAALDINGGDLMV